MAFRGYFFMKNEYFRGLCSLVEYQVTIKYSTHNRNYTRKYCVKTCLVPFRCFYTL